MTSVAINLPRILRVGAGASRELVATMAQLGVSHPLVVTDPFMVQQGYAGALEQLHLPQALVGMDVSLRPKRISAGGAEQMRN